jgi:hypothetical protein
MSVLPLMSLNRLTDLTLHYGPFSFIIDDAFDYAGQETVRLRGAQEIPRLHPRKGWASVAVLDGFAPLAFRKVGQGGGSDFSEDGGL